LLSTMAATVSAEIRSREGWRLVRANEKTISTHELATASRAAARERGSLRNSVLCAIATVTTIAGTAPGSA
ncbi:hypothetical protein, partial [Rathayibacter sp. AY1E8]|uniref:hypothetical protein n=1 Tax=Rathayibacter sp. AY1E8 TaxID=2080555 RepID=UPI0015E3BFFB